MSKTTISDELLRGILAKTLEQELGLVVETNQPHQLAYKLYQYMKTRPEFASISIAERPAAPTSLFLRLKPADLDT